MQTAYILNQQEYDHAKGAYQNIRKTLDSYNPHPNTDSENIPDLKAPVTITAGALHEMEHQLMILAAQLGIYE